MEPVDSDIADVNQSFNLIYMKIINYAECEKVTFLISNNESLITMTYKQKNWIFEIYAKNVI